MTALLDRPNISQNVAEVLREMIFTGELKPGSAVNEVALAAKLGVSRTPLREALCALVAEKAIDQIPRRGFFVRPLSITEAAEIYSIRQVLDVAALREAVLPSKRALDELDEINERLRAAQSAREAIRLDDEWHFALLSGCTNKTLMELIHHLVLRTHRYELGVMGRPEVLEGATKAHKAIVKALRNENLDKACELLSENLGGIEAVTRWLARLKAGA